MSRQPSLTAYDVHKRSVQFKRRLKHITSFLLIIIAYTCISLATRVEWPHFILRWLMMYLIPGHCLLTAGALCSLYFLGDKRKSVIPRFGVFGEYDSDEDYLRHNKRVAIELLDREQTRT